MFRPIFAILAPKTGKQKEDDKDDAAREGQWKADAKSGRGWETWADGSSYEAFVSSNALLGVPSLLFRRVPPYFRYLGA